MSRIFDKMLAGPEQSGEKFRSLSGNELGGAAVGFGLGGFGSVITEVYIAPKDGLSVQEKEQELSEAQSKLGAYSHVYKDAKQSGRPDAADTRSFTGHQIKRTKKKIAVLDRKEPVDAIGQYGDTFAVGALVGTVIVTAVTHGVRRWKFHRRNRS